LVLVVKVKVAVFFCGYVDIDFVSGLLVSLHFFIEFEGVVMLKNLLQWGALRGGWLPIHTVKLGKIAIYF